MKKLIYKNEEIDKIVLEESGIKGIKWIEDTNTNPVNIEIEIDWNGQQDLVESFDFMNIRTKLFFSLVHNAKFDFEFKNPYTIGKIEITNFSYIKKEHVYTIEFKFDSSPVGFIKFNCVDFYFEIIE